MPIPSRADWGEIDEDDIELQWTFNEFFGKSFSEAEAMFECNALNYQEDLVPMPAVPFNFYAPALANYITSLRAKGDSDGASSYLEMVLWMFKTRNEIIYPETKEMLLEAARQVANKQEFFGACAEIYGCFADRFIEIDRYANLRT